MNWLDDFLSDTKQKLPFEIPKETTEKLHSYYELFKEKTNEVKHTLSEQMKEFGSPLTEQRAVSEQPVVSESRWMEPQKDARTAVESIRKDSIPMDKVKKAIREEEILVKYKITFKQAEGEIVLPKDSTDDTRKRAILEHSGYRVTTTVLDGAAKGNKNSTALTGFNSYASLFSKF